MAYNDITRYSTNAQKKTVNILAVHLNNETRKYFPIAGNYLIANLPPNTIIIEGFIYVNEVSNGGTCLIGVNEAGSEILSAAAVGTKGKRGTAGTTMPLNFPTGTPVYLRIPTKPTTGDFIVIVEYIEHTKNTGEYTTI